MLVRLCLALIALAGTVDVAAQACGSRLFLSGFSSTVHVYDACTGAYLRNLDVATRLRGAMAVRLGPDGFLYVVAEQAGAVHKYRNDTLEYAGVFVNVPNIGATGLAFDAAGVAYVASYTNSTVYRFNRSGGGLGQAFPPLSSGLQGADNGMTFGPDGNLYIPGYDSANVVRWNPTTGATSVAVPTRTAGLQFTRGLLPARDNQHMFITSEGSGAVLKWNPASGAVSVFSTGFAAPRGIDYAPDGKLLVTSGDSVMKVDPDTGAQLETFVPSGTGGVSALVFAAVIPISGPVAPVVDATQIGTQFWVVGDGVWNGRTLEFDAVSGTGTAFGATLRFSELTFKRWGRIRIELVSCNQARFSWDATGANSAGFGSGGYDAVRYLENEDTARCRQQPLDNADRSWVNGMWWGGSARAGEGFTLDRNADGTTFFAWFTHRPPASMAGVDTTQIGTQYWITADARFSGRALQMDAAYSATGTTFGPGLRFADLSIKRWGSVRFELVSCNEGRFSWDSTGTNSGGFGTGSYTVFRYFENEDTARCRQRGVDNADKSWVSGMWWGGAARSGEGFILDRGTDGTTFFAWFTHRPR
jgi:hypothetical protein